jgi:excisionase family DNA binding protein
LDNEKGKKKTIENPPATEPQEFLTVSEAAALLRVGRNALYEAIQANTVPGVVRIGRLIRIRRGALKST